jgi:aspartate aminotransferase-like enzyme/GNAT superfamily N-acetyltransferase
MAESLIFKIAAEAHEFEQIHRLNFRTFVEERPQHPRNAAGRLVDRRHEHNTYVICLAGGALAGMVALGARRPFSLDEKLPDLDACLPYGSRPCEVRLLAVEPRYRKSAVFPGLVAHLARLAIDRGHDLALISGTTRQLKLYAHLGFTPFGPRVGSAAAPYQPMMLTLGRFRHGAQRTLDAHACGAPGEASFLPGPVEVAREVRAAFRRRPQSHRSEAFGATLAAVKRRLRELTGARHVGVLLGSGTLANDAVAAQLSLRRGRGLVSSNGEFGERLVDHARRWRLDFDVQRSPWGEPLDLARLARALAARPAWLWLAHCETSTGMLNDLREIEQLCRRHGTALCLDAVSSLGTLPVDLRGVALASGVSGKGLGAYPGIALVFHAEPAPRNAPLPRYLDLAAYEAEGSVPYTQSSNLLAALHAALGAMNEERFERIRTDAAFLRDYLAERGLRCVSPRGSPVLTIALPATLPSAQVARLAGERGYRIAYNSAYLLERNWIQVALMGAYRSDRLTGLAAALATATGCTGPLPRPCAPRAEPEPRAWA